jgi:hypothetical protein
MSDTLKSVLLYKPHNMLISGITNCGKTHFVLDLIVKYYFKKFNYIVIFCPTYFLNSTYRRSWIFTDKNVMIINLESIKLAVQVYSSSNALFIIDDCSNSYDAKRKNTELHNLAFSGRHSCITVWVLN